MSSAITAVETEDKDISSVLRVLIGLPKALSLIPESRYARVPANLCLMEPSCDKAFLSSLDLNSPIEARFPSSGFRSSSFTLPRSPRVRVRTITSAPAEARSAITWPVKSDSSSGCACTRSTFLGLKPAFAITTTLSVLALAGSFSGRGSARSKVWVQF